MLGFQRFILGRGSILVLKWDGLSVFGDYEKPGIRKNADEGGTFRSKRQKWNREIVKTKKEYSGKRDASLGMMRACRKSDCVSAVIWV